MFSVDPELSHPDIVLNRDSTTMTCTSFENRVALGDVGFSRGVHYWEVLIDKYEGGIVPISFPGHFTLNVSKR